MPIELLVKNATGLPDKYVEMVVNYIHDLQAKYQQEANEKAKTINGKPILRVPGEYKGLISMSEDFDAPLDDFKEYM